MRAFSCDKTGYFRNFASMPFQQILTFYDYNSLNVNSCVITPTLFFTGRITSRQLPPRSYGPVVSYRIVSYRDLSMSGRDSGAWRAVLTQCCIDDSEEMARLLVEYGANVDALDSELWTPLHAAATCAHVHLCRFLVQQSVHLLRRLSACLPFQTKHRLSYSVRKRRCKKTFK